MFIHKMHNSFMYLPHCYQHTLAPTIGAIQTLLIFFSFTH